LGLSAIMLLLLFHFLGPIKPVLIFSGIKAGFIIVTLALVLLASRKRNNIAKWALILLTIAGYFFYPPKFNNFFTGGPILIGIIFTQCVGTYYLFTRDSREWFKR